MPWSGPDSSVKVKDVAVNDLVGDLLDFQRLVPVRSHVEELIQMVMNIHQMNVLADRRIGLELNLPVCKIPAELPRVNQLPHIEKPDHDQLLAAAKGAIRPALLARSFTEG